MDRHISARALRVPLVFSDRVKCKAACRFFALIVDKSNIILFLPPVGGAAFSSKLVYHKQYGFQSMIGAHSSILVASISDLLETAY